MIMKKIVLFALVNITIFGSMAMPGRFDFKHKDGSSFNGILKGDEWFSWIETNDGYIVKYNHQTKNYEYMIMDANEKLIHSGVKARSIRKVIVNEHGIVTQTSATVTLNLPSEIKKISREKLGNLWKKARETARNPLHKLK